MRAALERRRDIELFLDAGGRVSQASPNLQKILDLISECSSKYDVPPEYMLDEEGITSRKRHATPYPLLKQSLFT